MSVGFANAVAVGLRYNGVPVSFEPGWETRGNGFVFPGGKPQGLIEHHTGSDYGTGLATLVNGRVDLDPPLCNCCTYPDGRIHIIAAQPANHAGAAAGRSLGPFAAGGLFNPRVWGNEIMYPGSKPMTAPQRRSALILGGVILGILGKTDPGWVRLHGETSGEGKWDPGDAPGHTIDGNRFRADIWAALTRPPGRYRLGDDMSGEWKTDTTPELHKVTYPIGTKVSGLVSRGWLSIEPSEDGAVEVWARGNRTGAVLDHWAEPIKANQRWWKELKDGTEGCTVLISTVKPGVAGWCLELKEA